MKSSIAAVLGGASTALAAVRGFNYASQGQNQASFESQFKTAAGLAGAQDFTSARLYTMIQDGTTNTPIEAIPAAIATKTTLLLGLWASQDNATFQNEIAALKSAIGQYSTAFTSLVQGISVGSEDLYRISATGLTNDPTGVGQTPDVLVNYISQVRTAIAGTPLSSVPVGHVDTWNAFTNSSNSAVIGASDFLGLDEYPYYQNTDPNSINNASFLFFQAYDRVQAVSQGKKIWVTESGWPTTGPNFGAAVPSVANAETYWQQVACELEKENIDFWWYILNDDGASPSFGVESNGTPKYNLACNSTSGYNATSGSSTASGSSATKTGAGSTGTGGVGVNPMGASSTLATPYASRTPSVASGAGSSAASTGSSSSATPSTFHGAGAKIDVSKAGMALGGVALAMMAL